MMIEKNLLDYLKLSLDVPVFIEEPEKPPLQYCLVDKQGSSEENLIISSTVAIQSYGRSRLEAAEINESVKVAMRAILAKPEIIGCKLNSDYPFNDIATNRHRYQAVFDITHY